MFDLYLTVDEEVPSHMILLSLGVEEGELNVSVSPKVKAEALVALHPQLAMAIADAIDEDSHEVGHSTGAQDAVVHRE